MEAFFQLELFSSRKATCTNRISATTMMRCFALLKKCTSAKASKLQKNKEGRYKKRSLSEVLGTHAQPHRHQHGNGEAAKLNIEEQARVQHPASFSSRQ